MVPIVCHHNTRRPMALRMASSRRCLISLSGLVAARTKPSKLNRKGCSMRAAGVNLLANWLSPITPISSRPERIASITVSSGYGLPRSKISTVTLPSVCFSTSSLNATRGAPVNGSLTGTGTVALSLTGPDAPAPEAASPHATNAHNHAHLISSLPTVRPALPPRRMRNLPRTVLLIHSRIPPAPELERAGRRP